MPHTIVGSDVVEGEVSDSAAKDTFLPDFPIEITVNNFGVMDRALSISRSADLCPKIGFRFPNEDTKFSYILWR